MSGRIPMEWTGWPTLLEGFFLKGRTNEPTKFLSVTQLVYFNVSLIYLFDIWSKFWKIDEVSMILNLYKSINTL